MSILAMNSQPTVQTGFLSLRSHTTERPLCEVEARMCCTLRFHATLEMSEGGPLLLAPGEYTLGEVGLLRSVMNTSDSPAPEARRLDTDGLNSRPRTCMYGVVAWVHVDAAWMHTGGAPPPGASRCSRPAGQHPRPCHRGTAAQR